MDAFSDIEMIDEEGQEGQKKAKKERKVKIPDLSLSQKEFLNEKYDARINSETNPKFKLKLIQEKEIETLEMKIRYVLDDDESPIDDAHLKKYYYKHKSVDKIIKKVIINKKYYREALGLSQVDEEI